MQAVTAPIPRLTDIPFLKDADPSAIAAVEEEVSWLSLPGGTVLFEAGEPAEALYFVVSGSLAAFRTGPAGRPELAGYIRQGEPVGEMSLVANEPHSGTVYAIRDTELLMLERHAFNRLVRAHPSLMQNLARLMLMRTRQNRRRHTRAEPRIYGLLATSPTIDLRLQAEKLANVLRRTGKRVAIVGSDGEQMRTGGLDVLEAHHDLVLLLTPMADTPWFYTVMRQADRLWVLARGDARPSTPLFPPDPSPARQFRLVDLVMLHNRGERRAAMTSEWMDSCDAARVLHWSEFSDEDTARLARILSGHSVGLVLGGGGARAYAHLGAVRALRDARHPIDLVGGTSMGAVVAACVAMGWDDSEIEWRIRRAFVDTNPLGDFVLPVVAFVRGGRVEDRLFEHFGDVLIEDLTLPFYCVSTNLTTASIKVHRRGLLRDALRASISLPGILPPVVRGDDVLVDGAVLANFPVDVMREAHRGSIIGVDVARQTGIDPEDFRSPPNFLGWVSRQGLRTPPPIVSLLMRTATLSIDPWTGRDRADLLVLPDLGDVDLRDWKKFETAAEAGYRAMVEALKMRAEAA
jgi:NTE family protein